MARSGCHWPWRALSAVVGSWAVTGFPDLTDTKVRSHHGNHDQRRIDDDGDRRHRGDRRRPRRRATRRSRLSCSPSGSPTGTATMTRSSRRGETSCALADQLIHITTALAVPRRARSRHIHALLSSTSLPPLTRAHGLVVLAPRTPVSG